MTVWSCYARVSGHEQVANNSIPTQISACHQKASELGATTVVDFVDAGVPGDLDWTDRPALNELLDLVEKGQFAGVVVYDPDRLARDLGVQLAVTEMITRKRVHLEFCTQTFDASPEGVLFYQLRGAISQFERAKIRERTNRGRKKLLRDGRPANKPSPYGLNYDRETNTWTVIDHQADIVRKIFEWARTGVGPTVISKRLNDQCLLPPRGNQSTRWWAHTIQRMLKNSTYVGRLYVHRYNLEGQRRNRFLPSARRTKVSQRPEEEWIEVSVPAIISEELWGAVHRVLHENQRRNAGSTSRNNVYLASRLLRCGDCGSAISGATASRKNSKTYYYRCNGRYGELRLNCKLPHLRADVLDETLWQEIRALVIQPSQLKVEIERAVVEQSETMGFNRRAMSIHLKNTRSDIARLFDLINRGAVREQEVRSSLKELRERERALDSRLKTPEPAEITGHLSLRSEIIDEFNATERQEFIRGVLTEILVQPNGHLNLKPRVV